MASKLRMKMKALVDFMLSVLDLSLERWISS